MRRSLLLVQVCCLLAAAQPLEAQSIFTIAGGGVADGRPATIVGLSPTGIAADVEGNLYLADSSDHRVRKVDRFTGIITTYAGDGSEGFGGDGGPATRASLHSPNDVAFDAIGNLYIADTFNLRIRRVDVVSGIITTVAGSGTRGFSGDDGPATLASFDSPRGISVDGAGNLFIGDRANHRIRRVDVASGIIKTVAGNGIVGFTGDGGPATEASLAGNPSKPSLNLAVDASGHLFVADSANHRIRRVDALTGVITTFAGNGKDAFAGDGGPAAQASLSAPDDVSFDSVGNLYIADTGNLRIRRVDLTTGIITTVAGSGEWGFAGDGGPATAARFKIPDVVTSGGNGTFFVGDRLDHRVRRIDGGTGVITTIAGNGTRGFTGDDGLATEALLSRPGGVAIDGRGGLIVADAASQRVRRIDLETGIITTVSGTGDFGSSGDGGPATEAEHEWPGGVAVDDGGNLYIADRFAHSVRRIDGLTGTITTVAGSGERGFGGDGGLATSAQLAAPNNIAASPDGDLYIADTGNHRVRFVEAATGVIRTIAGNGVGEFGGDDGPATQASLFGPGGVALDVEGNLYIADADNNRIRRVDAATGIITTIAGGGSGSSGDGGPAVSAGLSFPEGVAVGPDGALFIADTFSDRVRRVDLQTGIITTVAGSGTRGYFGDAGPATGAAMTVPEDVTLDSDGNLYIADTNGNRVRVVYRCIDIESVELVSPTNGSQGLSTGPVLRWTAPQGAFRYDVYVDVVSPPQHLLARDVATRTFSLTNLAPLTTYYWKIVAKGDPYCDPFRTAESEVRSFTTTSSCEVAGFD